MKTFSYFILVFMLLTLGVLFFNSGISARNDKYINDVILAQKGENTLENNKNPKFVSQMFALNDLIYNETIVGTINYDSTILINDESVSLSIEIDIYQTMPLLFDDNIKHYFHGIVNKFTSSIAENPFVTITGYYENNITSDNNYISYQVRNLNFPIFGLNDTVTNSAVNRLNSAVFKYQDVELFEIVLHESNDLDFQFNLNELPNYPADLNGFYNVVVDNLTVRAGGFEKPNDEEVLILNGYKYDYYIFDNIEQFNYLIYIYMAIYLGIVLIIVYFVFIRKRLKQKG